MIWPKEVTLVSRTQPSGPLCLWQCFENETIFHLIERCICWRIFFGRFELTSRGGTNVWRGSSKSHLLVSRQIRRCLFREEGILNPLAKFYAASQMSEVQAWVRNTQNEAIWVDHMNAREKFFLKPFSAQMRSILEVWTLFNSCTQALCPEVKDSIVEKLIDTV